MPDNNERNGHMTESPERYEALERSASNYQVLESASSYEALETAFSDEVPNEMETAQ